jgi:hypothetical protein
MWYSTPYQEENSLSKQAKGQVAILYAGDRQARESARAEDSRMASVFAALQKLGIHAEAAVYHDDFCDEVAEQLKGVQCVLVWVNPVQEDGRDRSTLDAMLRETAAAGTYVSTHPDTIRKMGTKEVLYTTREMGWGGDTRLYHSLEQMQAELPERLATGKAFVLKEHRGHSGFGVWKLQSEEPGAMGLESRVILRHAKRGSVEESLSLGEVYKHFAPYFSAGGRIIDQAFAERLPEGMLRCYMVIDQVVGFGLQAINALYPAPEGGAPADAPQPGPRLYHPPTLQIGQKLKEKVESHWVPEMLHVLGMHRDELPLLWDCDFLYGPKDEKGEDSYVLCEINVSCVAPYPDSAPEVLAEAVRAKLRKGA